MASDRLKSVLEHMEFIGSSQCERLLRSFAQLETLEEQEQVIEYTQSMLEEKH